jgi:hypothetical protein
MWNVNLSSLAAKAKEAAARLESQLDDSIGIADDSLFGARTKNDANTSALETTQEDDLNEDDDFFSDHQDVAFEGGEVKLSGGGEKEQVTKLDVTAEEGDDFFGDETNPTEVEAVEFGGGGDGWDEGDDIALDDDVVADEQQDLLVEPEPLFDDAKVGQSTELAQAAESLDIQQASSFVDEIVQPAASEEGSTIVSMPPMENEIVEDIQDFQALNEPMAEPELLNEIQLEEENDMPENQQESEVVTESEPLESEVPEIAIQADPFGGVSESYHENETTQFEEATQPVTQIDTQHSAPSFFTPTQMDEKEKLQYLETISQLEAQLLRREEQLASKSEQITSLTMQNEAEITKLRQVVSETKEEAKKRILKAKERVEEMQTKLAEAVKRADSAGGSSHEQSEIIAALRAEGEQLARKQSQMEQSVRSAKTEARDLSEQLQIQTEAKEAALQKIVGLEQDIKTLKEDLSSARKGESQSKKLEGDLVAAKEESEKQRVTKLGLEQQLNELREENKTLKKEAEDAKAGAAIESERESNKLRKERDDMLGDLESKLRTSEREANVREDALRHEVSELRKRWQDAVRRAEGEWDG